MDLHVSKEEAFEMLARLIHESGREAVEKRLVYRDDLPVKPFCEWDDLHEPAKEGRRSQARFFLKAHSQLVDLVRAAAGEPDGA